MRSIIYFFILILFGCSSKPEKKIPNELKVMDLNDSWICIDEKKEGLDLIDNNSIQYILINEFPRFEVQLNKLLSNSKLQLRKIGSMHGEGYCLRKLMDSVINIRFGHNFREEIENEADSLFLELNRSSIFPEEQLDHRPTLVSNLDTNGQNEIIKRLNSKISNQDSIKLISNIVNSPYFVIQFVVERNGISRNAKIIERNSTENFKSLEKIIINEINGLVRWTPAQIRNEYVDSSIDVAIAVLKN